MASWKSEGGGGYLNGVAFTINTVRFEESEFEVAEGQSQKVSAKVNLTPEGGEAVDQFFDAGFMPDGATISKDGKSIAFEGSKRLSANSDFIRLVSSMVENGFPEDELGDGEDFTCLEDWRFIGVREKDPEQQKRVGRSRLKNGKDPFGKKIAKNAKPTDDEAFEAGKRGVKKGEHKGKLFDLDVLLVSKTVGKTGDEDEKPTKSSKPSSKSKKVEEEVDENEGLSTDRKDEVLGEILAEAKGTISRGKLQGAIVTWAADSSVPKVERDELREALYDEDYLNDAAERGIITYDSDDKKQPIAVKAKKKR